MLFAFADGLITQRQFEDLDRLRRIRNQFAHNWEPVSFSDDKIASHISALHFSTLEDVLPSRSARDSVSAFIIRCPSLEEPCVCK